MKKQNVTLDPAVEALIDARVEEEKAIALVKQVVQSAKDAKAKVKELEIAAPSEDNKERDA